MLRHGVRDNETRKDKEDVDAKGAYAAYGTQPRNDTDDFIQVAIHAHVEENDPKRRKPAKSIDQEHAGARTTIVGGH